MASEEMSQMIDKGFHKNQLSTGSDTLLFEAQENHLVSVLECVLQTSEGKRLTRKHPGEPRLIWKLHEEHATSSTTSSNICTGLSQELAKMKIVTFDNPTKGLDTFYSYLITFNKTSPNSQIPDSFSIMYLKLSTCGNSDLLSAWTQCEAIKENMTPEGPLSTYDEYYKYLLGYAKKLKAAVEDNTPSLKVNSSGTNYLTPYSPSDPFFSHATDLSAYMSDRGHDVDMIQDVLHCHQAMKQGRPRPPPRTRREPVRDELKIRNSTWSGLQGDTESVV